MEKIENKKQILIHNAAKELFWKHGFKRVSVEEICKCARVSKMTFYRFYSNKIELAKAVYTILIGESMNRFHEIIHEDNTIEEKIKKILLLKLEETNEMSTEFLNDFYSDNELGLKEFVKEKTQESWKLIIDDFVYAQNKGWFRKDVNPELIMLISQKLTEMTSDTKVLKLYKSPQALIMAITDFFIYGITPHTIIR